MSNTWEDKLHDKMTSAYSKSCGYKKFPSTLIQKSIVYQLFHSGGRFQKVPFSWIFLCVLVWTEAVSVTIKLRFQIYLGASVCVFRAKGTGVNEL